MPQPPIESNLVFMRVNGTKLNLLTGNQRPLPPCPMSENLTRNVRFLGEAVFAPSLPATVRVPSNFGDFSDPRQLLVEGFLADPMTPFNNPSVIIRDDLGRAVFKLEIKWAADFLHTIVVTSELNNVSTTYFRWPGTCII